MDNYILTKNGWDRGKCRITVECDVNRVVKWVKIK